jgi:Coenzyme PQQ synthesis protein D (PqqD)
VTLTPDSVVVAAYDQVSNEVAGQAVILDLSRGLYYGLDEVGATVWRLMAEPRSVAELASAVCEEYDVTRERAETDLLRLLSDMAERGLVQVRG